jgi:hypothetical protein
MSAALTQHFTTDSSRHAIPKFFVTGDTARAVRGCTSRSLPPKQCQAVPRSLAVPIM